jgi:hypothetical protein
MKIPTVVILLTHGIKNEASTRVLPLHLPVIKTSFPITFVKFLPVKPRFTFKVYCHAGKV